MRPVVKHSRNRVTIHLPEDILNDVLTDLARALADDAPDGPVARTLADLADADLITSTSPEIRREWGVDPHATDAWDRKHAALNVLRNSTGLVWGMSPDTARRLITLLSAHVAGAEHPERAA